VLLLAKRLRGGDDDSAKLGQRFAADVDGAATRDQQQPQRLAPLTSPREREYVAGERGPCDPGRVQRVVFAAQPTLAARDATDLEHALSACMEIAAETGAVAAGTLDRPGAAAGCVLLGEAKQLAVAVRVRGRRRSRDNGAGRRRHDRYHMLVAVGINAEHVVQFVCKHQTRSSDSNS
jgi:hypothetical protein